jgi:hypothetical protein
MVDHSEIHTNRWQPVPTVFSIDCRRSGQISWTKKSDGLGGTGGLFASESTSAPA